MLVNCWPTPGNNGTCEVNIEYELENEHLALHDVVISIPLPSVHPPSLHSILLISFFSYQHGFLPNRLLTRWRLGSQPVLSHTRLVCPAHHPRGPLRFP